MNNLDTTKTVGQLMISFVYGTIEDFSNNFKEEEFQERTLEFLKGINQLFGEYFLDNGTIDFIDDFVENCGLDQNDELNKILNSQIS